MTHQQFLISRRKALLDFFSWRFGTDYWVAPAVYCTGLPASLFTRLRSGKFTWPDTRKFGGASVRDIFLAEQAALHLGFKPARYPYLDRYSLLKPPPMNLPKWSDPEVVKRFKAWQKLTSGERERVERKLADRRRRYAERKRKAAEALPEVGNSCRVNEGSATLPEVGKSCPVPPEETQS